MSDNLLDGSLEQVRARERRLSEHYERACTDRRLMAAASISQQLDALRAEIRRRESHIAGRLAFASGIGLTENPHRSILRSTAWQRGWCEARDEAGFVISRDPLTGLPIPDPRDDEECPL